MKELFLYHYEGCSYCTLVRDFIDANHITVTLKDTRKDPLAKAELLKIGGKTQVPCLVMDGKALYESADIIQWLKDNRRNL